MPFPSRVSVRDRPVWFDTVITTGPAPTLFGEIVTFCLVITPVSCNGTGGRGFLAKYRSPPHPVRATTARAEATAIRRMRTVCRMTSIPRARTLSKPDGFATCDQAVDFALDLAPYSLGDRLHEREVFCVLGCIFIQRNGFEEPNLEFR